MPDTEPHPPSLMTDDQILDEAATLAVRPEPLELHEVDRLRSLQVNAEHRGLAKALDRRVADACVAAAGTREGS